jgi:segregation and condensation protein B
MRDVSTPPEEPAPEEGLSLDQLSAAFARALAGQAEGVVAEEESSAEDDVEYAEETADPTDSLPPAEEQVADDGSCQLSPRSIFEAMLFVGDPLNQPLAPARAAELMRGVAAEEIPALVDDLNRQYAADACPYVIVGEADGYRLVLRASFRGVQESFYGRVREARLSQAAIDVLAIVAYRQPVTIEEINRIRGLPSNHVVAQLVRRELLMLHRPEGKRQPAEYHTTDRFLRLFGMERLDDLPQADDIDSR